MVGRISTYHAEHNFHAGDCYKIGKAGFSLKHQSYLAHVSTPAFFQRPLAFPGKCTPAFSTPAMRTVCHPTLPAGHEDMYGIVAIRVQYCPRAKHAHRRRQQREFPFIFQHHQSKRANQANQEESKSQRPSPSPVPGGFLVSACLSHAVPLCCGHLAAAHSSQDHTCN